MAAMVGSRPSETASSRKRPSSISGEKRASRFVLSATSTGNKSFDQEQQLSQRFWDDVDRHSMTPARKQPKKVVMSGGGVVGCVAGDPVLQASSADPTNASLWKAFERTFHPTLSGHP
ncbi:uncharacterized protein CTRU02_213549 [Colletotrichum truncatum]|uniref:Uncharacterized protein n=1 Tax=Colletotrichum truncatum TaxID=5467 RepID=A0ACC3YG04_COLTU|nr:uncharacterized protein CTRU02_12487 [Colletotrichum truncatum]KAF6784498.1 hypothetical protein CTRU02_12487 [Colletotrichum truncatum]